MFGRGDSLGKMEDYLRVSYGEEQFQQANTMHTSEGPLAPMAPSAEDEEDSKNTIEI